MDRRDKLIYLAGIIDGEGCFWRGQCKNGQGRKFMQSRILITNTNKDIMQWLVENFGGRIQAHNSKRIKHPTWQEYFVWALTSSKAEALALEVKPYLIIKKEKVYKVIGHLA